MAIREEIGQIIGYMKLAFPNYSPTVEGSPNTVDVLCDLLGDLPTDTLRAAVKACCSEAGRAFAPSAGEIRGAVSNLRAKIDNVPSAGEAWGEIIGSFERMPGGNMAGGGHTPILDHPLVQKAIHCMGGFNAIGADFFDNQMANRAHFLRIYADLLGTWKEDAAELPAISGYIEGCKQKQIEDGVRLMTDRLVVKR